MISAGLRAPQRSVLAGLRAPHPDMGEKEYMRGSASRSDRTVVYMRGFTPHPDRAVVYMRGFTPHPDLGSFFGKKLPKDPKKPNCIGFRLSSIDSKKGCRRQPCFLCSANGAFSFSAKVSKLTVRSFKNIPRNEAKQARLSSLRSVSIEAAFFTLVSETSIVSISYAKVNSSNLSGMEHSF